MLVGLVLAVAAAVAPSAGLSKVRAISFDVTGTLITHGQPVMKSYADAAVWARLPNPPTAEELKPAFKQAYKDALEESPCFGGRHGTSGRDWWRMTIRRVLANCRPDTSYTEEEFDRYFRRVYQHFMSPKGYERLEDADTFLSWAESDAPELLLGITSNTPTRHMDSVLPMLGLHDHFRWFTCSQDVGVEKPAAEIFDASFAAARFWMPDLQRSEILHIGDSLACDYCGAKAAGFQALLLDRSSNEKVTAYQDWVVGPDYPGKSAEDIQAGTVQGLDAVVELLTEARSAAARA